MNITVLATAIAVVHLLERPPLCALVKSLSVREAIAESHQQPLRSQKVSARSAPLWRANSIQEFANGQSIAREQLRGLITGGWDR